MKHTVYFLAKDANEDETLWRQTQGEGDPVAVIRKCDVPHEVWEFVLRGMQ